MSVACHRALSVVHTILLQSGTATCYTLVIGMLHWTEMSDCTTCRWTSLCRAETLGSFSKCGSPGSVVIVFNAKSSLYSNLRGLYEGLLVLELCRRQISRRFYSRCGRERRHYVAFLPSTWLERDKRQLCQSAPGVRAGQAAKPKASAKLSPFYHRNTNLIYGA